MNTTVLSNGDMQVGDYKFRISQEYLTVVYYLTERCNFRCSYCVGWHDGGRDCLTDKYPVEEIVDHFRYLQESSGKKLYIWLTGGEPSVVTDFSELARLLTMDMDIELQTNLCTKYIKDFAKSADPKRVGAVMASYHGETLDINDALRKLYFENFRLLMEQGFTVVLKTMALPEEIPQLEDKIAWLRTQLPDEALILVQPFIAGAVGPRELPNSYPYFYTEEEKRTLQKVVQVRRAEIFDYINGAGWFHGMRCDAGRGFIAMDKNGDAFRCVRDMTLRQNPLGNLIKRNIQLLDVPKPCRAPHCNAPFWSLWYGVNPWDYMGKKAEDCEYCRFAPSHLRDEKTNLKLVEERKVYAKGRLDLPIRGEKIVDRINTLKARKTAAKEYLRWASMLNSAKDYRYAKKYVLKSLSLDPFNPQALSLLAILFLAERIVKVKGKYRKKMQEPQETLNTEGQK